MRAGLLVAIVVCGLAASDGAAQDVSPAPTGCFTLELEALEAGTTVPHGLRELPALEVELLVPETLDGWDGSPRATPRPGRWRRMLPDSALAEPQRPPDARAIALGDQAIVLHWERNGARLRARLEAGAAGYAGTGTLVPGPGEASLPVAVYARSVPCSAGPLRARPSLDFAKRDAGIGIVYLESSRAPDAALPWADTVTVRAEPGRPAYELWPDRLATYPQFFIDEAAPAFFDAPGGTRVDFPLAVRGDPRRPRPDYRLEPLGTDGPWMRVRVVTPDASCGREPGPTVERPLWIEYLTDRGRPRVWYYARGC